LIPPDRSRPGDGPTGEVLMFRPISCHGCGETIEYAYKKDESDHKWHYRCWLREQHRSRRATVPDDREECARDERGPLGAKAEALVG
jgi:hypothetical protein